MGHIFWIKEAQRLEKELLSGDPEVVNTALATFNRIPLATISRLPTIAALIDHEDAGVRSKAISILSTLAWADPTLIRPYVSALGHRLAVENNENNKYQLIYAIEPFAKEGETHLLAGFADELVKHILSPQRLKALQIVKAMHRRAPEALRGLSEVSREILERNHIGEPRKKSPTVVQSNKPKT